MQLMNGVVTQFPELQKLGAENVLKLIETEIHVQTLKRPPFGGGGGLNVMNHG